MCVSAVMRLLKMNTHDYYGRHSHNEPPLVDILDLRSKRKKGSRTERGLRPMKVVVSLECCDNQHLRDIPFETSVTLWNNYEKCATIREENDVLVTALWCQALGRVSGVCLQYIKEITGCGEGRYSMLIALLEHYQGVISTSPEYRHELEGHVPVNASPPSVVQSIINVVQIYTRPDPTNDHLICCNDNFSGPSGMLRALEDTEPVVLDKICDKTALNIIQRYIKSCGLRGLCTSSPDHNVCALCKYYSMVINDAHIEIGLLDAHTKLLKLPPYGNSLSTAPTTSHPSSSSSTGPTPGLN